MCSTRIRALSALFIDKKSAISLRAFNDNSAGLISNKIDYYFFLSLG